MIPSPGESIALFQAADTTAAPDYSIAVPLQRRDGSATLTSGHEWRAWVSSGDTNYLEDPSEDIAASWVVEVLSGTVTLTAAEGVDPDYGDTALVPSTSLGSHTVTGPATLVIPSTFTAAQIVNEPDDDISFMLVLSATSGSALVQQVKLRAWPAAGVVGGWGDTLPGFDDDPVDVTPFYSATVVSLDGAASSSDPQTAWDDAYSAFLADVGASAAPAPRTLTTTPTAVSVRQSMSKLDLSTYSAEHLVTPAVALLRGQDWRQAYPIADGLVEGVDWIVPPNEVPGDVFYYVQRTGDGSAGWLNAVVTVAASGTVPGNATAASVAGTYTGATPSLPVLNGGSGGAVALDTSGRDIAVTVSHSLTDGDGATWPGWEPGLGFPIDRVDSVAYGFGVDEEPVKSYATLPPYQVWTPTAVVATVGIVRHWPRNDGRRATSPARIGQQTSQQSGRGAGYS